MNTAVAEVHNPFGAPPPSATADNAVARSESERAIQEVQAAMVIAKKFPRDQIKAMERILNACTRETLANTALYSYPRGGQEVTGPSIRLAEALAQEWGNMQFGIRELSAEGGVSTVEAFAWDVETNTRQVKVFQVPHVRHTRSGVKKLTDPRDVYEMVANQGARRLRACILGVIPGDVTEAAVNQCEVTQAAAVDVSPEKIQAMVKAFKDSYGVPQELIEKRLGKRAESINAAQMLSLRKIYQSLKDGMSKPGDWFDIDDTESAAAQVSDLNDALRQQKDAGKSPAKAKGKSKAAKKPAPAEPAADEQPALTFAQVAEAIKGAETLDALSEVANTTLAEFLAGEENEKFREELDGLYQARETDLTNE